MGLGAKATDRMAGRLLRSSLRILTIITFFLGLVLVVVEYNTLMEKEKRLATEQVREQSLRKLLRQHGREIQASINNNFHWFMRYLARLRTSIKTGLPVKGDDEEEDSIDPDRVKLLEEATLKALGEIEAGRSLSGRQDPEQSHETEGEEASGDPNSEKDSADAAGKKKESKKKKKKKHSGHGSFNVSTLNNLDMPMHKVHGKMEPCLDLLPEGEVAELSLPPPSSSSAPSLRRLQYYVMDSDALEIEKVAGRRLGQRGRSVELDLFWGRQTMAQREQSYQVREEMEVHCGFAAPDSGFEVSREDQEYLKSCSVAVVTASFGGGDYFAQPIGISKASLEQVCFVAFWDEATQQLQAENGVRVDESTRRVGLWRVVVVRELPFVDQRLNGKIPKILPHRLLPNARFSIWVDSKYQFRRDPLALLESLLWRPEPRVEFAISEHGSRKCTYLEGEAVVMKHKAGPEEVAVQMSQYRAEGLPANATYDGRTALAEASIIIREHTPATNLFMCCWFNEMVRFTSRDQLSFVHVLRRLNVVHPRFFTVCARRAMVNKLGHMRKASPLRTMGS